MNPKSSMGTVISMRQLERIETLVQRGVGKVLVGGKRMTGKSELDGYDFAQGAFFPPTVITDVPLEDDLWREEIFGPVVVVTRFSVRPAYFPTSPGQCMIWKMSRASRRASSSRTPASTGSARAFGRRTCRGRTGCLPTSRRASCG